MGFVDASLDGVASHQPLGSGDDPCGPVSGQFLQLGLVVGHYSQQGVGAGIRTRLLGRSGRCDGGQDLGD